MGDRGDAGRKRQVLGAIKARFARLPACVTSLSMGLFDSATCIIVRGTAGTRAILSARASSNDHIFRCRKGDRTVLLNLHRLDLDASALGHCIEGFDTGQAECRSRQGVIDRTVFAENGPQERAHIGQGADARRWQSSRRRCRGLITSQTAARSMGRIELVMFGRGMAALRVRRIQLGLVDMRRGVGGVMHVAGRQVWDGG